MNRQDAKDAKEIESLEKVSSRVHGYDCKSQTEPAGARPKRHAQSSAQKRTRTRRYTFTSMMRRVQYASKGGQSVRSLPESVGIDSRLRDHRDHRGTSPFLSESNPGEMAAVSSMAIEASLCPLCPLCIPSQMARSFLRPLQAMVADPSDHCLNRGRNRFLPQRSPRSQRHKSFPI